MFGFLHGNKKETAVTVSNSTIIRFLLLVTISFLLVVALKRATHALTLIFIAFFLALALNAPVHWLAVHLPGNSKGNRTLAIATAFIAVVLVLAGFVVSFVPPLVRQTSNFVSAAPNLLEDLHNQNTGAGDFIRRHNLEGQVDKFANQLSDRLKNFGGSAFSTLSRLMTSIFSVLTVLVLTFMMLIEGPRWIDIFKRLLPDLHEKHLTTLALQMYGVIKGYVNGQLLLAALAALLIAPMLFILHINYPVALMVIIFICGLIPLVGHTIGAIIVTVVALFHSLPSAIIILAYYIFYQQIETYAVQPRIQASATEMSPLLVFMSVIIGVSFSGLLGGLVAIPVAGCIRILILDYLNRKNLLEPNPEEVKV